MSYLYKLCGFVCTATAAGWFTLFVATGIWWTLVAMALHMWAAYLLLWAYEELRDD